MAPTRDISSNPGPAPADLAAFPVGSGRPVHTLGVVRDNVDMYQTPARPSAACRTFGKVTHHATSFLAGAGITGGTTYALVKHVQHAIANAQVSSDPAVWLNDARAVYDNCYNGCHDCDDTAFAFNACAKTATAVVNGTACDGNAMWNWLARYPEPCLAALGDIIRAEALASTKQGKRDQLAIILLTVLAGAIGWYTTHRLIGCVASRMGAACGRRQEGEQ